jgi:hypothetical protein
MKRLIFLALMMVCSAAWAEWEFIGEAGDGDNKRLIYVDKSTIRKKGAISRMWDLEDYYSVQTLSGDRYMSIKEFLAFNCGEETFAVISASGHSGAMAEGNTVWSKTWQEREWRWDPVSPGTAGEAKWKIACGKK